MAYVVAERVQETTSNLPNAATAFNLDGAVTGGRTFVAGIGDTNTCMYCAQAVDGTGAREALWEIGVGTVTDATPDTITRSHFISSSSGSAIDFSTATAIEIYNVNTAAEIAAGGGESGSRAAGIYYYPIYPESNLGSRFAGGNAQQLYYPMIVTRPRIISAVAFDVTGAGSAGHEARVGIHESVDGVPGSVRVTLGTVLTDTVAFKQITGLSHFLPPGIYFLTLQTEGNAVKILGTTLLDNTGLHLFGVLASDRNRMEGIFSERASAFPGALWAGDSEDGLLRKSSNLLLPCYKFTEV